MDPTRALIDADQAISDLDLPRAAVALMDYADWRHQGGFEPVDVAGTSWRGDAFEADCYRRLCDARLAISSCATYTYNVVLMVRERNGVVRAAFPFTQQVKAPSMYEGWQQAKAELSGNLESVRMVSIVQL